MEQTFRKLFDAFFGNKEMRVASWWDYGYQIAAMANRTGIVDNNTWNNTHIATVGTAMSSPEKPAWEIFSSLDVKYVLVVFGVMISTNSSGWFALEVVYFLTLKNLITLEMANTELILMQLQQC